MMKQQQEQFEVGKKDCQFEIAGERNKMMKKVKKPSQPTETTLNETVVATAAVSSPETPMQHVASFADTRTISPLFKFQNMMQYLPEDIIFIMQSFISQKDYRNLLNSSKIPYFQQLKKISSCYHLSLKCSQQYYSEGMFKSKVLSLITDPEKQLGITTKDAKDLDAEFRFSSVKIIRYERDNLSPFATTPRLFILHGDLVTNCDGLRSIIILELESLKSLSDISQLSNCPMLSEVILASCGSLRDINSLSHVKKISIRSCPITDKGIEKLGPSLTQLRLSYVEKITNLDHLVSLEKLNISYGCDGIESISGLQFLKDLTVRPPPFRSYSNLPSLQSMECNCEVNYTTSPKLRLLNITSTSLDLERLQNFSSLRILSISVANQEGINVLAKLPGLRVLYLRNINDSQFNIHLFQQIVWLKLFFVPHFQGFTHPMPKLHTVRLDFCDKLETFQGLENNRNMNVKIIDCLGFVPDLPFYHFLMESVRVFSYKVNAYYEPLPMVPTKETTSDGNIRNKSVLLLGTQIYRDPILLQPLFSNIQVLGIDSLGVTDLSSFLSAGIHKIPVLTLTWFFQITSLYPVGVIPEHQKIRLVSCKNLEDISSIVTVPHVAIKNCPSLKNISLLRNCPRIEWNNSTERPNPLGFEELEDRIEPFLEKTETHEIVSLFEFNTAAKQEWYRES